MRPAPSTVIARPVRKAPPTAILEIRRVPEIVPVQEAIPEESGEEMSSPPPSEDRGWADGAHQRSLKEPECVFIYPLNLNFILQGDEEFQSAVYGSPTPPSPQQPGSLCHIDSNAGTLTEASSSAGSLDIKTPGWSPERRSPFLIGSPEKKPGASGESSTTLYFSADAQSPSSGSYLGWGSELSPISIYRSPYRIREARFVTSTPRLEPRALAEAPSLAPVIVTPATPGTTPGGTPGEATPVGSTTATSASEASTPAGSTPAGSTPGASSPSVSASATMIIPLSPVISHARKQVVQFMDYQERAV